MTNYKTILFIGPTVSEDEVQSILPNACCLPPIQCGDIIKLLRLKPRIIGIIDGFFETRAAVWHKEIVLALEKGIHVLGSSSMGALRGSELYMLGMQGVGQIFEDFKHGYRTHDDDVALLHQPEENAFAAITIPLVNLDATINQCKEEQIITVQEATQYQQIARNIFYQERTLDYFIQSLKYEGFEVTSFLTWIDDHGIIDQKKKDALDLLYTIRDNKLNRIPTVTIPRSIYLRTLYKDMMVEPFEKPYTWLPEIEQTLSKMKNDQYDFSLLQRLAYSLSALDSLAESMNIPIQKMLETLDPEKTFYYYLDLMRLAEIYLNFRTPERLKETNTRQYTIISYLAQIWHYFQTLFTTRKILLSESIINSFKNEFLSERHIKNQNELNEWLEQNTMSQSEFEDFIIRAAYYEHFVLQNNLEVLGIFHCREDIFWLGDAFRLIHRAT